MKSSAVKPTGNPAPRLSRRAKILLALGGALTVLIIVGAVALVSAFTTSVEKSETSTEKAVVDGSVRIDLRDTVASVENWESQDPANRKVVIDNATTFVDANVSNKIFRTKPGTIIGVYAPGDGSYTVCGYNPAGSKYTTSRSALGYDSATGLFEPVLKTQAAEACVGAIDARGNNAS